MCVCVFCFVLQGRVRPSFSPETLQAGEVKGLMMFYDWRECMMSVLGTTKHS